MKTIILTTGIVVSCISHLAAQSSQVTPIDKPLLTDMTYNTIKVDGYDIFYREAGAKNKEVILFLHGFPSSSHMYRNIMAELSSKYHVIAPDYPGFGLSDCPSTKEFNYTFDNIALIMEHFIDKLAIKKLNLYMQDYGGPVGYRIAAKRPHLIQSLIIQNANAYFEGLGPALQQIGKLQQAKDTAALDSAINFILSYEGIKVDYLHGAEDPSKISPDSYAMDSYFMERKGIKEIQFALFKNYHTNFPKYQEWQQYFRQHQPPALVIWGNKDNIFISPGAEAYKKDLKNAELHILNGGHFALEEHHKTIAFLIDKFLSKKTKSGLPK